MAKPGGSVQPARFDKDFLRELEEDPERVLKEYGIQPTPAMIDAIREMDFGPLYRLAETFVKPSEPPTTLGARMETDEVALVFP